MNNPGFPDSPSRFDEEVDELADLQPGTRVGPYVIVDRIGRGGMGQVFLGSDPRLQRKVALKCLISARSRDSDRRARILREAQAAAGINHPNVAAVYDVVEQDGRAFIVMEYVEGESLAARLKRERLELDDVVGIGRQLVAALAAAHATGVIHRDLKPANVLVGEFGETVVIDWGLAEDLSIESDVKVGSIVGTPAYMPPEQARGDRVGPPSDVYALGAILYEILCGRTPYEGAPGVTRAQAPFHEQRQDGL